MLGLPTIESRIRLPATELLYEVCRVQKLDAVELSTFDDRFIDHLFDLVETTRDLQDERLNYAVIKLIVCSILVMRARLTRQVALNEQFMVSTIPSKPREHRSSHTAPLPSTDKVPDPSSPTSPTSPASPLSPTRHKHLTVDTGRHHHRALSGQQVGHGETGEDAKKLNRVLMVLMRRLGSSKTFGENVIFMLNRAGKQS